MKIGFSGRWVPVLPTSVLAHKHRGLATNLHELGTDDKEIQAILRHSDVRLTQNIYIQSVDESQVDAMEALSEKLEIGNVQATSGSKRIQ